MKSSSHLAFIRSLPCLACGDNTSTEAAHVRMSDYTVAKYNPGMGQKPEDCFTVPLCSQCHRNQHFEGEVIFWSLRNIDPVKKALALYAYSGNHNLAGQVVRAVSE